MKFSSPATITKVLFSAGLIALLLFRMEWPHMATIALHLHPVAWLTALAVLAAQILLLAWRWGMLCDDARVNYPRALTVTLAALLSNLLLITSVSGVLVRIALSVQHGMTWVKATCAAAIDRLMTVAALVLLAALLMPALENLVDPRLFRAATLSLAVFIGIAAMGCVLFFGRRLREFLSRNVRIREVGEYLRDLSASPARAAAIIISSLVAQVAYFIAVFVIARATGAEIGFMQLLTVLPVIALVASLPLSVGGWGIREGAFVYGLGLLGVPMETAFLISVQIGLLGMLSVAVTALPVLAFSNDGRGFIFNPRGAVQGQSK
jgi:uncharacterized membrane protein YbhN (UPF0104 family)